jgi:hypothetical protein
MRPLLQMPGMWYFFQKLLNIRNLLSDFNASSLIHILILQWLSEFVLSRVEAFLSNFFMACQTTA